jgi:hypothetical protein
MPFMLQVTFRNRKYEALLGLRTQLAMKMAMCSTMDSNTGVVCLATILKDKSEPIGSQNLSRYTMIKLFKLLT